MPGHKLGKGFKGKEGELFNDLIKADVTELPGLDNLHNPEGIIKEAEDKLRDLYGSVKSYFLVNGSTSGNLIAIFSSFNEGDKVIVERTCHVSVMNGILLRKLNPIYIYPKVNKTYKVPIEILEEDILEIIRSNEDAKGIILTSPNYYGVSLNLDNIIVESKKRGIIILIDGAHGSHFIASPLFPEHPLNLGADIVVNSAHKTLPALTQGSFLHINNSSLVPKTDFYFHVFSSTSPSYLLLASLDYSRYYLEEHRDEFEDLLARSKRLRSKLKSIQGIHLLEEGELSNSMLDITRVLLKINKGVDASIIKGILRENNIEIEYNDLCNLILIFSPFNTDEEFDKLYHVLKGIDFDNLSKEEIEEDYTYPKPIALMNPHAAFEKEGEEVLIKNSLNRVIKRGITFYPPGIPFILPGEVMDINTINMVEYYLNKGIGSIGIENNKIQVIK